jgi:hypothetical protein
MRRVSGQQRDFTLEDRAGQKGDGRGHDRRRVNESILQSSDPSCKELITATNGPTMHVIIRIIPVFPYS